MDTATHNNSADLSAFRHFKLLHPREPEELLEGYPRFLCQVKELLGILDRIVGGSTYWGWKIEWGCQPWHLMTYQQQKGLTLQASC